MDPSHRVHVLSTYKRYSKADGAKKETVPRWRCTAGCCTISVLPDTRLPYRLVDADLLEAWLDADLMSRAPPHVTENERGCLKRAHERFLQRIPSLTEVLGQMINAVSPTATQLWVQLRKLGKLRGILRFLAEDFKTSLLGNYRCLRPRSISKGVMHLTSSPMHAFGILILFVEGDATSCVTTVCPWASAWATT